MSNGNFSLLRHRRFLPLFASQFLGAANDNFFRNALAILVTFRLGEWGGLSPQVLTALAPGIFIAPYFLFSAIAGRLADRYEKSTLMKILKGWEIAIAVIGVWALTTANVGGMLLVLFLLGAQSTFTSPIKYAVLPEYLDQKQLLGGNALMEGGTFLAILLGTIAGGTLILLPAGDWLVAAGLVGMAILGFAASLKMPMAHGPHPEAGLGLNPWRETRALWGVVAEKRDLRLATLGISWFWLMGSIYLSQFPAFAKVVLGADEHAVTVMLTMFSLGIGLGSILCGRLLKGEVSARHVPLAALCMSLFAIDLWLASPRSAPGDGTLLGLSQFLAQPGSWRILVDLLGVSVAGGVYTVPLYAILQARSDEDSRARAVAANNISNAAFMVVGSVAAGLLLGLGLGVTGLFLLVGLANLAVVVIICGLLPDEMLRALFGMVFRLAYRVRVQGLDNLPAAGERVVMVANHVSFLDPALLAAFLPEKPVFAVNTQIATVWWVRPFLRLVRAFPVDPTNPMATKSLVRLVESGERLVIFPEGRLTVTGALMKIYDGPAMIAHHADAWVLPIRIDGAERTPFTRLKGKIRRCWFPVITISILPPRRLQVPSQARGRDRRHQAGELMYDAMSEMMFGTTRQDKTLYQALLDAASRHGASTMMAEDINRRPLSYRRMIVGSIALGRPLARITRLGEAVGLLLPNTNAAVVSFFALQGIGRVPAMLNFSAGAAAVLAACRVAQVGTVVTSRRFIDQGRLTPLVDALAPAVRVVYLEDIGACIGTVARMRAMASLPFIRRRHRALRISPQASAVILFTSGTEGTPKGVVLSHANIMANCAQLSARVAFSPADRVFNALPMFHAFGLTGGTLLPILAGLRCFFYPSPLHYRVVPELVYDSNATIMFGTDTFLSGYARMANPYDFQSVRLIFAGAEKLRDETRRTYMDRFGVRILEGYGVTEAAPVLAVNTPMHCLSGSVGRLLPGIAHRLEPVPGIDAGARLLVHGPNIMLGYLKADQPGKIQPLADGWYDTGDIVTVDDHGFVHIVGRAKRFCKIAGEMVSLGAVEDETNTLWSGYHHAVVAIPDDRKGERLVLITTHPAPDRAHLTAHFRARHLSDLMVPRIVLPVPELPVLGSGKTDYVTLTAMAQAMTAHPAFD